MAEVKNEEQKNHKRSQSESRLLYPAPVRIKLDIIAGPVLPLNCRNFHQNDTFPHGAAKSCHSHMVESLPSPSMKPFTHLITYLCFSPCIHLFISSTHSSCSSSLPSLICKGYISFPLQQKLIPMPGQCMIEVNMYTKGIPNTQNSCRLLIYRIQLSLSMIVQQMKTNTNFSDIRAKSSWEASAQ